MVIAIQLFRLIDRYFVLVVDIKQIAIEKRPSANEITGAVIDAGVIANNAWHAIIDPSVPAIDITLLAIDDMQIVIDCHAMSRDRYPKAFNSKIDAMNMFSWAAGFCFFPSNAAFCPIRYNSYPCCKHLDTGILLRDA